MRHLAYSQPNPVSLKILNKIVGNKIGGILMNKFFPEIKKNLEETAKSLFSNYTEYVEHCRYCICTLHYDVNRYIFCRKEISC